MAMAILIAMRCGAGLLCCSLACRNLERCFVLLRLPSCFSSFPCVNNLQTTADLFVFQPQATAPLHFISMLQPTQRNARQSDK